MYTYNMYLIFSENSWNDWIHLVQPEGAAKRTRDQINRHRSVAWYFSVACVLWRSWNHFKIAVLLIYNWLDMIGIYFWFGIIWTICPKTQAANLVANGQSGSFRTRKTWCIQWNSEWKRFGWFFRVFPSVFLFSKNTFGWFFWSHLIYDSCVIHHVIHQMGPIHKMIKW